MRGRLLAALKVAFAALVVVLVVKAIPWRDTLRFKSDGDERVFTGTIVGDWKSESGRIQFDLEESVESSKLPAEWNVTSPTVRVLDVASSPTTSWQPGIPRVFREVDRRGLVVALCLFAFGIVATSLRWWRLLGAAGCPTRYWPALRLTAIGFFFNIVVPGLTGGDVIKAVLVARDHPERRAAAAMSVLVDRLVGVLVLALMGAVAIVAQGQRFAQFRTPVLAGLVIAVVGAFVYGNEALRRVLRFEQVLAKLPFAGTLKQLDEAVTVYSRHPREFLLAALFSFANQCCVLTAIGVLARAFGDQQLTAAGYVVVGCIGNLASAVPITPGGIGVTEAFYGWLFEKLGGLFALGVAVSVGVRLCMITIGLLGGLFLLLPSTRRAVREARDTTDDLPQST
jgi:uncharacterized protein (TIRG00374 family)